MVVSEQHVWQNNIYYYPEYLQQEVYMTTFFATAP